MAIFIIDQFSLNTDLPLDIRYVPTTGRFDPDVSVYKYPGMQVFDTNTESIWYADNSLNWVEVGSGSDASLNDLYDLVIDLSTYITNNVDVSIANLYNITNQLDASIQRIDLSINSYGALLSIHEASIGDLEARVSSLESSVGTIEAYQIIQDASIATNASDILQIEASISNIETSLGTLDGLIQANTADILQIEASISNIETSLGTLDGLIQTNTADILQIEASIANIETSLGTLDGLIQANTADIAQLDASIIRIDGSLNVLFDGQASQDASIADLRTEDIRLDGSITLLFQENDAQDASIVAIEASLGDYVRKDGDTMTGPLVIDASLQVNNTASFLGNVDIGGNLVVDGSFIYAHATVLDISTAFIELNTGLTGTPPSWLQSGIIVQRGDASSYAFIYDETLQSFRIGIVNGPDASGVFDDTETQSVATRQDNPIDTAVAVWNDAEKRFDTYSGLTFDPINGLSLDLSLNLSSYAGASNLMLVVQPDGYVSVQTIVNYDASLNELYGDVAQIEASIANIETSLGTLNGLIQTNITDISNIETSLGTLDSLIQTNTADILQIEASIANIETSLGTLDGLIQTNTADILQIEASIANIETSLGTLDGLIQTNTADIAQIDASIIRIDGSIVDIYDELANTVKGAINVGDGSASIYTGTITADGSIELRTLTGVGAAVVTENGNVIEISLDASFLGEVNTASNVDGGDASIFAQKVGEDLVFRSIKAVDPTELIITNDASFVYFDVSIAAIADASLVGLTDTSINVANLVDHTNLEYDASQAKWVETQNNWWDTSLATTATDIDGVPAGTVLEGDNLKEILYKILYAYQLPTITATGLPVGGTYEKGLTSTSFPDVSISYSASNSAYPLAKLNNLYITKTGVGGNLFEASLGLVDSSSGTYTDNTGITNWGGTTRTINYNVYIEDDQDNQGANVFDQVSYTFYYRQYWGVVDGNTNVGQVDSSMITNLTNSRLAGESDLNATFVNPGNGFIKYLFAYPDTVAAPDNFGLLSEVIDQNDFDITDSFNTENEDVSVGASNVRYRFYLSKNKVDTATFDITFKF